MHFASPRDFNDPFGCKVHFVMTASDAELRRWYTTQVKKKRPSLNRAQRRLKVAIDLKRFDRAAFVQSVTRGMQEAVNRVGVLSLSAVNDNILLWSHYADGHAGLCLQFPGQRDVPFFGKSQEVVYSPTCPKIDPIRDSRDRLTEAIVLTKALEWTYEAEWRIIDHIDGPGEKRFPEDLLLGVILGAEMSAEDRTYVVGLVNTRKHPVNLYEAVVRDCSFGLEIRPFER